MVRSAFGFTYHCGGSRFCGPGKRSAPGEKSLMKALIPGCALRAYPGYKTTTCLSFVPFVVTGFCICLDSRFSVLL